MGIMTDVASLAEGDLFDAAPLVEYLFEQIGIGTIEDPDLLQEFADSARATAECLLFEVDRVERIANGNYVVYGSPFNLPAGNGMKVEVMEW